MGEKRKEKKYRLGHFHQHWRRRRGTAQSVRLEHVVYCLCCPSSSRPAAEAWSQSCPRRKKKKNFGSKTWGEDCCKDNCVKWSSSLCLPQSVTLRIYSYFNVTATGTRKWTDVVRSENKEAAEVISVEHNSGTFDSYTLAIKWMCK